MSIFLLFIFLSKYKSAKIVIKNPPELIKNINHLPFKNSQEWLIMMDLRENINDNTNNSSIPFLKVDEEFILCKITADSFGLFYFIKL